VVLSNASLDIAFHDVSSHFYLENMTNVNNYLSVMNTIALPYGRQFSFKVKNIIDKKNIEQFWVGLLEGDGSIIVRKNKQNNVYGGFEISLKYLTLNEEMLNIISKHIGGRIYYEKKKNQIIKVKWVAVALKDVNICLNILNKYPLLTSRKICQLEHLNKCLENKT
jgi:hypothetical protein